MIRLVHLCLKHPIGVLAWAVALLVGGVAMALLVPLEWTPSVRLPALQVETSWYGASPHSVERYVTAPIERAFASLDGTASIESRSLSGQSLVTVEISKDADISAFMVAAGERLHRLQDDLPERVKPRLSRRIPASLLQNEGFMTIQLVGMLPPDRLRLLAREHLVPRLQSTPGVATVTLLGGTEQEVLVTVDADAIARHGIRLDALRQRLFDAVGHTAPGTILSAMGRRPLLQPGAATLADLRRLPVPLDGRASPLSLGEVARVEMAPAPEQSISRVDGQSVVTLVLARTPNSNLLGTAKQVRKVLAEAATALPSSVQPRVIEDKSDEIRAQLIDLAWRGGGGLLLVLLLLVVMFRSVRATACIAFSVVLSMAVALALFQPLGLTLNLITLAGLALLFGLLVDNSVVVVERILLNQEQDPNLSYLEHADTALRAVWLPLLGGTLTTVVILVPLLYLSGELRVLFVPFATLVTLTLLFSLVVASLVVPVLVRSLPVEQREQGRVGFLRRVMEAPGYLAARFPRLVLAVLALLFGLPFWLLPNQLESPEADTMASHARGRFATLYNQTLGTQAVKQAREWIDPATGGLMRPFFEHTRFGEPFRMDIPSSIRVWLNGPSGMATSHIDSLIKSFEHIALAAPVTYRTVVHVQKARGSLTVYFTDEALKTSAPFRLRNRLIAHAGTIAGLGVSVGGLLPNDYANAASAASPLDVTHRVIIRGPQLEEVDAIAHKLGEALMAQSQRFSDYAITSRFWADPPEEHLLVRWGPDAERRTGTTLPLLIDRLRAEVGVRSPMLWTDMEGRTDIGMRLVVEGNQERTVRELWRTPLILGQNHRVRLETVSTPNHVWMPDEIQRIDQQYRRYLALIYLGDYKQAATEIDQHIAAFDTPAGYTIAATLGGWDDDETRPMLWVVLGTILLVYLTTALVFESWRLPLVMMTAIPCALLGVALAFLYTDLPFSYGAFIGTTLLVGIAANDLILLLDLFRQLQTAYPHRAGSVLVRLALRERLRPMWTTTLTSICSMIPLTVAIGDDVFWAGLAATVIGGLLSATLLSIPAAVALLSLRR